MSESTCQIETLAIVGVGLIGGSIAAAAKSRGVARTIIGHGRSRQRLASARECGLIDECSDDPAILSEADLIVVCTPVDRIAEDLCIALDASKSSALVTDAGSVKSAIVRQVGMRSEQASRYVPAHPLAGSHLTGFENANPDLYVGRVCVLTPTERNSADDLQRVSQFWEGLEMQVRTMSPDEHDRILAVTSHLPHLVAAAVAAMVSEKHLEFASSGYRDTTRVAAGDPDLWTAIFSQNASQLASVTDELIDSLKQFRDSLTEKRHDEVRTFLQLAQERRQQFRDRHQTENLE